MDEPILIQKDPWLQPYGGVIKGRWQKAMARKASIEKLSASLKEFANGFNYFGLHRTHDGWVFREWAPNATEIFLTGVFSDWKPIDGYKLKRIEEGKWELYLPKDALHHGDLYHLLIRWKGGEGERIPAWANRVVQDENTKLFNAQVWRPKQTYKWKNPALKKKIGYPLIYEAHVGMATEEERVGTYEEFRTCILPRIIEAGYNTIQLMAIQEHPYYGSFGYHVSNYFAPSSRFGTPEELKALIDEAHTAGIAVIMDIVHSHAVKNVNEGLGLFDGTGYQYFHEGPRREHVAWDSLCFDYGKDEVLHFLLSNCRYWIEEFKFDGFRFDGVTSMLYYDHGLSRDFTNYGMYYDGGQDEDAITYFVLANSLIHEIKPEAITVAEEMSGMPGLAAPIEWGGYGFDYRMAMGIPDYWIKIIKEVADENWNVGQLYHELTSRRQEEKTIGYAESHDQALVGDKTIIFRLIDKEMYWFMNKSSNNLIVDRGIALHKMIRLVTIATAGGGYLNFIGNEFGHPEWIDFPRAGNNWSFKHARRQWSLVDNKDLKYHYLSDFDRDMIHLIRNENLYEQQWCNLVLDNSGDQILAFERKNYLFVFNFNPERSFTDYGISTRQGKYKVVLNTDSERYGGFNRIDESLLYMTSKLGKLTSNAPDFLKLYLPNRTALVFKREESKRIR
ncbi:MAG: alpha amylase C-terminal domain-containing protein [Bacteroidales bacterium]|nr:alpha amylase C-terminal domain-containing protein [Bacteroidales bacterium]